MFQQEVKFYNVYSTSRKHTLKQTLKKKTQNYKIYKSTLLHYFEKMTKKLFKKIELI